MTAGSQINGAKSIKDDCYGKDATTNIGLKNRRQLFGIPADGKTLTAGRSFRTKDKTRIDAPLEKNQTVGNESIKIR